MLAWPSEARTSRRLPTVAKYADGRVEEVDVTEAFTIEILGRDMVTTAMLLGEQMHLGMTVLAELDLLVDCTRQRLIPIQTGQTNQCFACSVRFSPSCKDKKS